MINNLSRFRPKVSGSRRRDQLERDLQHITEQMYLRNKELADTNETLSLLRTIDSIVLESTDSLEAVCGQVASVITAATNYPLLAILTRRGAEENELQLYGWSVKDLKITGSFDMKHMPAIDITSNAWLKSPSQSSSVVDIDSIEPHKLAELLGCSELAVQSLRSKLPIKTICLVKLVARQNVVGVLAAGFFDTSTEVNESAKRLMERLCEPVGIALDNRLLFEENKHVLRQLRHSNSRLKKLNESKDDFIGMASHQLRTPLTSVKGYLSLVIDGDAGKINATQRTLLEQAFTSSQRMVYLIADLLNVSRLKTGKFVVERVPTNLSKLVSDEMAQLKTAAASHDIKLLFDAPATFPTVMLDETKTRQVIMNFMDNAIYYTPKGGHIHINLRDLPQSIELEVIDDGIGVPQDERHHLFTKFYRAKNAQRARPDGTGLGLFMAKKVIVAQGGALIFDSKEGVGSKFGFSFPKAMPAESAEVAVKSAA